jgi:hypothetical protein
MIQVERSTLAEYPRMTRPALGAPLPSEPCAHPCGEGSAAARLQGDNLPWKERPIPTWNIHLRSLDIV